jgi:hypothetical protein
LVNKEGNDKNGDNGFSDLDIHGGVGRPEYSGFEIDRVLQVPDVEREIRELCNDAFQLQRRCRAGKNGIDCYKVPFSAMACPRALGLKLG